MNPWMWSNACLVMALVVPAIVAVFLLAQREPPLGRSGPLAFASIVMSSSALSIAWLYSRQSEASIDQGAMQGLFSIGPKLLLDGLAVPFVANLMAVALLSLWYAQDYAHHVQKPHLFYALLLLFIDSMLGACLANDMIALLILWELMLITSYLLLLLWGEGTCVASVTTTYFIYTQAGSLLLLSAVACLDATTGSTVPKEIAAYVQQHDLPVLKPLVVALLLGFGVKMAIAPLHGWLPDAHAIAPMPVTILLAAAMLSLGAYGVLRFVVAMLGASTLETLQIPLMVLALVSQIYGALMSLSCSDIKRIIAYSSISQMGYVLFGMACLSPLGMTGSVLHIISHGLLKAFLFMGVGIVISRTGRREIETLGGLAQRAPKLMAGFALAVLAMAGLPPLIAFYGEWRILLAGLSSGHPLLGAIAFVSPILTACYGLSLVARLALSPATKDMQLLPAPRSATVSASAAFGLVIILGLLGGPLGDWVSALLSSVHGGLL